MNHRSLRPIRRGARVVAALLVAVMLSIIAVRARAATSPSLDEANRAYAEGRYGEAATDFEALVAAHGYSAPLLFDLGNAYLRDGQPVRAILAYQRAQLLAPRDAGIATNLAVARAAAAVPDESDTLGRVAHVLPMDTWAWLAAGGFWLTAGALVLASRSARRRRLLVAAAVCAALTTGASVGASAISSRDLRRGLVMQAAPVLVSPFEGAQSEFALAPGASIELGRARDGYVFIHDATGRSGWVERAEVEPLIPRST